MTHIGTVIKSTNKQITVEIEKEEMCDSCTNCKGCLKKTYQIVSENNKQAQIGNKVKVYTPDSIPLLFIFISSMLPIIILIVSFSLLYKIDIKLAIITAITALFFWLILVIFLAIKLKKNKKYSSYILEIL